MTVRLTLPERVDGGHAPVPGQVVWLVHGPGTNDVLVGPDMVARSIEETLWQSLHSLGFERIVFSSAVLPLFVLDTASAPQSPRSNGEKPSPPGESRMRFVGPGPLGRRLLTPRPTTDHASTGACGGPAPALSDNALIMTLRWLMTDTRVRSAVVLVHLETLLEHLSGRERRDLARAFAGWLAGGGVPGNVCVLVSDHSTPDEVAEFVTRQRYLPALATHLRRLVDDRSRSDHRGHMITRIGAPRQAELERLVHLARWEDGLVVEDWRQFGTVARQMAAQHDTTARQWREELRELAREGLGLSTTVLRKRGLVSGAVPDGRSAVDRLNDLVGLAPVKDFLARRRARITADALLGGQESRDAGSPHLVFLGNPGTGKTTVARLVGEMYRDLGLLARGHVIECTRADLVAEHVGGTAVRTRQRLEAARDGVLFIDEAYQLLQGEDAFGREAVETLLREMENERSRVVVIVAGYPEQMETFLKANPGLPSRFPVRNRITFPDYSPEELLGILRGMLAERGIRLDQDDPMCDVLMNVVRGIHSSSRRTFGNARDMRELAEELLDGWAERVRPTADAPLPPLSPADVPDRLRKHLENRPPTEAEVLAELDHLIGLGPVKVLIRQLVNNQRLAARRGRGSGPAPHVILAGSPGTGKTTVARILGRLFASVGLLRSGHVIEVHRSDLVAGYIGQTAMKTRKKVEEALDGVLFIDEAYSLSEGRKGDFGVEALTEITAMMENHREELVVIAAGYSDRMDEFLAANQGLASRFTVRIEFPDYSPTELREILVSEAARRGFTFAEGTLSRAAGWLKARLQSQDTAFGNAREVRILLEAMERNLADRLGPMLDEVGPDEMNRLTIADVPRSDP